MADKQGGNQNTNDRNSKKQKSSPNANHVLRRRTPQKPEVGPNILYVSTKTSIKGLLAKCTKLINNNENEIIIYCLGAAIQRGILLALQLTDKYPAFQHSTQTFSTTLLDDLEPANDDADFEIQKRFNSALKIRVFRTDLLQQAGVVDAK